MNPLLNSYKPVNRTSSTGYTQVVNGMMCITLLIVLRRVGLSTPYSAGVSDRVCIFALPKQKGGLYV